MIKPKYFFNYFNSSTFITAARAALEKFEFAQQRSQIKYTGKLK